MIKYNYEIIRDEGDTKRQFVPKIPTTISNLVTIEGPNSSGKSTLLHLLALGFYGLKNKSIKDSLQKKLSDLAGSAHQKLTFNVIITNDVSGITLDAQKKNPDSNDISVYETVDGVRKPITAEAFERKYKLIYDIPDDPIERLDELTRELSEQQTVTGKKVTKLMYRLKDVISEVQSAHDPHKIQECKKQLASYRDECEKLTIQKEAMENDRVLLKRFYMSKYFVEYCAKIEEANDRLKELEEKLNTIEKKERKQNKERRALQRNAHELMERIKRLFTELLFELKELKIKTKDDYYVIWKDTDLRTLFIQNESHKILFQGIKAFKNRVIEIERQYVNDGKLEEANFYTELIELLQHHIRLKVSIPGTDRTIPEIIEALERRSRECVILKKQHDRYERLLLKLDELNIGCQNFITDYLPELKAVMEQEQREPEPVDDRLQLEIDSIKQAIPKLMKRREFYRDEMIKAGVKERDAEATVVQLEHQREIKAFTSYSEDELESHISELSIEMKELEKRLEENRYHITRHEHEIKRLEEKKPHKHQNNLDKLNLIFGHVTKLEKRLVNEFEIYLKDLKKKSIRKADLKNEQIAYYDAVGKYLGARVGTLRHVEDEFQIQTIDLVERIIYTTSRKKILLTDLGTGQGQSAYLVGLLKVDDKRKIIALIDEVAMMDEKSMRPIYQILKEKYNNGLLLGGIVVQRGDALKVSNMLEK